MNNITYLFKSLRSLWAEVDDLVSWLYSSDCPIEGVFQEIKDAHEKIQNCYLEISSLYEKEARNYVHISRDDSKPELPLQSRPNTKDN